MELVARGMGCIFMLFVAVVLEMKKRRTFIWSAFGTILALMVDLIYTDVLYSVLALVPGGIMVMCSIVTNGIDKQDGMMVLATGPWLMVELSVMALLYSLFLCCIAGVIIGIKKGSFRGRRLMFSPFYLAGVIIAVGGGFFAG